MARGNQTATATAQQAADNSKGFLNNANDLYGHLAPTLESQMANPQGFTPGDEAAMETGAQQGAGGSQASAVGQGGLLAARTGNAGAGAKAISDASRGAGEMLSKNLLGIRAANANLKQEQKTDAMHALTGLQESQTGASNSAIGQVAPLVNADINQQNASYDWAKDIMAPILTAGSTVGAAKLKG